MKVLTLLSDGFEEIEAVAAIDVLRRAGLEVSIACVGDNLTIKGANGISIVADCLLADLELNDFVAIVLPGGYQNALTLSKNEASQNAIKYFYSNALLVAAICAAPIALDAAGVLSGEFTCYPGCEQSISSKEYTQKTVVVNNNIITSRGPGSAICFGLAIVEKLIDNKTATELKQGLLVSYC